MPFIPFPRLVAVLLTAAGVGMGAEVTTSSTVTNQLTGANVGAFARNTLVPAMAEAQIPGLAIAVVKGGSVVYEEGFGLADAAAGRPVSVERTVFRVASLSKVLTATAVLDLVERGHLNLDEDLNTYLDRIAIPPTFSEPLTLHHLLTHSAGLDYRRLRYGARRDSERLSLFEYLARFQPDRVRSPGMFSSYDNYGFALAGYIVQRAAGEPFATYMGKHWLDRLGMTNSSFVIDPIPQRSMARGYRLEGDHLQVLARDYVNIAPAAGLCTTGSDMAGFLVALLGDEPEDGPSVFGPGVKAGLLTSQEAFHPTLPGRCYGFNEIFVNGRRVLSQLGSWPGYCSVLLVFPQSGVGFFMAYNRNDDMELARAAGRSFAGRFIPRGKLFGGGTNHLGGAGLFEVAQYAGTYLTERFPRMAPSLGYPRTRRVETGLDHGLFLDGIAYQQIERGVFEKTFPPGAAGGNSTDLHVVFRETAGGEVSHLVTERGAFRRAAWYGRPRVRRLMLIVASLVLISGIVLWPVKGVLAGLKALTIGRASESKPHERTRGPWMIRGIGIVSGGFALWLMIERTMIRLEWEAFPYIYGIPEPVTLLMRLTPILVLLTSLTGTMALVSWHRRYWTLGSRVHFSAVTAALMFVCVDFYSRNLVGW